MSERFKRIEDQTSNIAQDYDYLRDTMKNMQDFSQKLSEDFSKNIVQLDEYKKSFATLVADLQKTITQNAQLQKNTQIMVKFYYHLSSGNYAFFSSWKIFFVSFSTSLFIF